MGTPPAHRVSLDIQSLSRSCYVPITVTGSPATGLGRVGTRIANLQARGAKLNLTVGSTKTGVDKAQGKPGIHRQVSYCRAQGHG